MTEMRGTPEKISEHIAALRASRKEHIDLLHRIANADDRALYGVDLVVIAVMVRAISLIDGFSRMVEDRNPLCANALLRLQLDNIMRLYACWLVDDPHSIAVPLLEGQSLGKVKSKEGKLLSDSYLASEASKLYPWLTNVYEKTSAFVHLSTPHMVASVTEMGENGTMSIAVGSGLGHKWTEEEVLESLGAFGEATISILHLCYSWLVTKEGGNKKRITRS